MRKAPSARGDGRFGGGGPKVPGDGNSLCLDTHHRSDRRVTQGGIEAEIESRSCIRDTKRPFDGGGPYDAPMAMNQLPLGVAGVESEFERIEVRRSSRRKKTISAEVVGGALIVSVPERLSRAEEQQWVQKMATRLSEQRRRDRLNDDDALERRARELSSRYLGGIRFGDIAWVTNQKSRWGSCSVDDRSIRISLALADYPGWVRDYVIVHELAHLIVPDHSERFWALVNRYPMTERARGFLMAKGMEEG